MVISAHTPQRNSCAAWPGWSALVREISFFVGVGWLAPDWFTIAMLTRTWYWLALHRLNGVDSNGEPVARSLDWVGAMFLMSVVMALASFAGVLRHPVDRITLLWCGIMWMATIVERVLRRATLLASRQRM